MRRNRDDRSSDIYLIGPGRSYATYDGTSGNDVYVGTGGADTINGYGGDDTLSGGDGDDVIDGGDGNDTIDGGAGYNELRGGGGYNQFTSSGGIDHIYGTGSYDTWHGNYTYSVSNLTFEQRSGTLSNGTELFGIDSFVLIVGYGNDRLRLSWQQRYSVDGGSGFDSVILNYSDYRSGGDYENVKSLIATSDGVFNITMYTDLTAEGYSTRSYTTNVEDVNLIGSTYNDNFEIRESDPFQDHQYVKIDGRGGSMDFLRLDLGKESSRQITVSDDGVVSWDFGTFANIERYAVILGGGTNEVILGSGNDTITSAGSGDQLYGGGGNDVITGYGADALMHGGDGDDTIYSYGANALVDGGDGDDTWRLALDGRTSTTYDQTATKPYSDGERQSIEHVRVDSLAGASGNVFLLDGSEPGFILSTRNANDRVLIDFSRRDDAATFTGAYDSSSYYPYTFTAENIRVETIYDLGNIPFIDIVGTAFDDTFFPTGANVGNLRSIDGGVGIDTITLRMPSVGFDTNRFVVEADGTVTSSSVAISNIERFFISIFGYDNVVTTGNYDDIITIYSDTLNGKNILSGGGGDDAITGGRKQDVLNGGTGRDTLLGALGDDSIDGGTGDDIIDGQAGIDTAVYADAERGVLVTIRSGVQNTRGAGRDLLNEIENLTGSEFNDQLTGDGGANRLAGAGGNDRLFGGAGADVLMGGAGADQLTGGAGVDTFAFASLSDFGTKVRDRINDFSHADGDRIDVKAIDPTAAAGDQPFVFIGDDAFSQFGAAELRARAYTASTFLVQGDADGDGRADFAFLVTADQPLTAADFVL